jgi:hypothetical protein
MKEDVSSHCTLLSQAMYQIWMQVSSAPGSALQSTAQQGLPETARSHQCVPLTEGPQIQYVSLHLGAKFYPLSVSNALLGPIQTAWVFLHSACCFDFFFRHLQLIC